jgi:hypothetical protein
MAATPSPKERMGRTGRASGVETEYLQPEPRKSARLQSITHLQERDQSENRSGISRYLRLSIFAEKED